MRKTTGLLVTSLLLAGCFNVDMLMEINGPDDVNYTMKMSAPSEAAFILQSMKDSLQNFDQVNMETRNDTVYLTATKKHIPIDSLTGFGFQVEKQKENTYKVWMEKTQSKNTTEEDEAVKALFSQYRITLTLVVNKGKILESNADSSSANTYYWKSSLAEIDEFSPFFVIQFPSGGGVGNVILIAGGVIVVLAAGAFFLLKRK